MNRHVDLITRWPRVFLLVLITAAMAGLLATRTSAYERIVNPHPDQEKDPALAAEFLSAYPKAATALQYHYEGHGVVEEIETKQEGATQLSRQTFRARPGEMRLDVMHKDSDFSYVANERRWFIVEKSDGGFFVLKALTPRPWADSLAWFRVRVRIPFAPYCIMETTVSEFIREPGFEITRAHRVDESGKPSKVRIDWRSPGVKMTTRVGWFVFEPGRQWLLHEYGFAYDETARGRKRAIVHYTDLAGDFPDVESVEYFTEKDGVRSSEETVRVVKGAPRISPLGDFSLDAFGILRPSDE